MQSLEATFVHAAKLATAPSDTRPASVTRPDAIEWIGVPSGAAMSSPSWKCG